MRFSRPFENSLKLTLLLKFKSKYRNALLKLLNRSSIRNQISSRFRFRRDYYGDVVFFSAVAWSFWFEDIIIKISGLWDPFPTLVSFLGEYVYKSTKSKNAVKSTSPSLQISAKIKSSSPQIFSRIYCMSDTDLNYLNLCSLIFAPGVIYSSSSKKLFLNLFSARKSNPTYYILLINSSRVGVKPPFSCNSSLR